MTTVEMYPSFVRSDDNPFITILVNGLREAGAIVTAYAPTRVGPPVSALHVHWLEQVTWGRYAKRIPWIQLVLARRLVQRAKRYRDAGRPVVWTVHNLRPHEELRGYARSAFEELRRSFLPLVTDVILMSSDSAEQVDREYPELFGAKRHVVPLPHFRRFFETLAPHQDVRSRYSIDADTRFLAVVGMLRSYKGIPALVEQAKALTVPFAMVVAGDGDTESCNAIRDAIGNDPRFILDRRRLSHADVASILAQADAALFNFESILNSASVLAALSMSTPVVCPASGALVKMQEELGVSWVQSFTPPLTTAVLSHAISRVGSRLDSVCPLDKHDPTVIGHMLKRVYDADAV